MSSIGKEKHHCITYIAAPIRRINSQYSLPIKLIKLIYASSDLVMFKQIHAVTICGFFEISYFRVIIFEDFTKLISIYWLFMAHFTTIPTSFAFRSSILLI